MIQRPPRPVVGQKIPHDWYGRMWDWIRSLELHGDSDIKVTRMASGTLIQLVKAAQAGVGGEGGGSSSAPSSSFPSSLPSSVAPSSAEPSSVPSSVGPSPTPSSAGPSPFPSSSWGSSSFPSSSAPSSAPFYPTYGYFVVLVYWDGGEGGSLSPHEAGAVHADGSHYLGENVDYTEEMEWGDIQYRKKYYEWYEDESEADDRAYWYMFNTDKWPTP